MRTFLAGLWNTLYNYKLSIMHPIRYLLKSSFSLFFFRFSKSECSNYQQLYTREASNVSISQFKWTLQLAVCATKTAMINSNFSASSPEVSYKKKFRQIDKFCQLLLFPAKFCSSKIVFTNFYRTHLRGDWCLRPFPIITVRALIPLSSAVDQARFKLWKKN